MEEQEVVVEEGNPVEKDAEGKKPSIEDTIIIFQTMAKMLDDVMPSVKTYLASLTDEQREQVRKQVQVQVVDSLFPPKSGKEKEETCHTEEKMKAFQEWLRRSSSPTPPHEPYIRGGYGSGYMEYVPGSRGPGYSEGPKNGMGGYGYPPPGAAYGYGPPPGAAYGWGFPFTGIGNDTLEKFSKYRKGEFFGKASVLLNQIPDAIQKVINENTDNALFYFKEELKDLITDNEQKILPDSIGNHIGSLKAFIQTNPIECDAHERRDFSSVDLTQAFHALQRAIIEFESMLPFIWAEETSKQQAERDKGPNSVVPQVVPPIW
jgi:hypothetical protein